MHFSHHRISHLLLPETPEGMPVSLVLLIHSIRRLFQCNSKIYSSDLVSYPLSMKGKGEPSLTDAIRCFFQGIHIFIQSWGYVRLELWDDFTAFYLVVNENQQTHLTENLSMKCSMRVKNNLIMYHL